MSRRARGTPPAPPAPGAVLPRWEQEAATLWRVAGFGRERHLPGVRWWFENRLRETPLVVLQCALEGRFTYRGPDGLVLPVVAGEALLFMHGEESAYGLPRDATEPFVTEFVALAGAGLREHWLLLRQEGSVLPAAEGAAALDLTRRLIARTEALRQDALALSREVHAAVHELVELRWLAQARARSPVERAVDDLLRAPTASWSLKEVAERHGVSREHLTRTFHRQVGEAPAAWLARARLGHALALLERTLLPVAEVARQAGYASTHTLARQVRLHTGRSPRGVRERRP